MKKLMTMATAILLTAGMSSFAEGTNPVENPGKKIHYQMPITRIVVESDIDLVLEEGTSKTLSVTGAESDVEKVDWKIKGDVLYLKSRKGSLKNRVSVRVTVNQLKEIYINGESKVESAGKLASSKLEVVMDGESYVSILNTGVIRLINADGTEFNIKRAIGQIVY